MMGFKQFYELFKMLLLCVMCDRHKSNLFLSSDDICAPTTKGRIAIFNQTVPVGAHPGKFNSIIPGFMTFPNKVN